MATILNYYEYAKLASAAYVDLTSLDGNRVAAAVNANEKIPLALANQMFDANSDEARDSGQPVWTIPTRGYLGNDSEGFAATFFQRTNNDGSTEKVLAIRGTEPSASPSGDLLKVRRTKGTAEPKVPESISFLMN